MRWKEFKNIDPSENGKAAYQYFVRKGLTPAQASGIVGNLVQESTNKLSTTIDPNDGSGSVGIAQWLGSRKKSLMKYSKDTNRDFSDLNTQLDFIWKELNSTEKKAFRKLKAAKTPQESAIIFSKYYERPSKPHNDKRQKYSIEYYNHFNPDNQVKFNLIPTEKPDNRIKEETLERGDFKKFLENQSKLLGSNINHEEFMNNLMEVNSQMVAQSNLITNNENINKINSKMKNRELLVDLVNNMDIPFQEIKRSPVG